MRLKNKFGNVYFNWRSKKFENKFIVIESDDWGSLRTESIEQRNHLNGISNAITNDPYIQLDGLASPDDLKALFKVLSSVKDSIGNKAILTANVCTANPEFDKIEKSNFERFHYEPFTESIARQANGAEVLDLWKEGQTNNLFHPQLHGREHLHALAWLKELRSGNKDLLNAFDIKSWGIPYKAIHKQRRKNLQAALDLYGLDNESQFQQEWLKDGASIFEKSFGFKSKTFIPPAYVWHSQLHKELKPLGINSVQGIKLQYQPKSLGYNKRLHFMGEHCVSNDIHFFPRNVFFEPSLFPQKDWFAETLQGIDKAFANKQPAIIGSHRINFIGKLNEPNRTKNLNLFSKILQKVVEKHKDVLFVTSDDLVNY